MTKSIATYAALILAGVIIILLFFTPMVGADDGLASRRAAAVREARLELSR